MKTKKRTSWIALIVAACCLSSCQEWGEWDDPSGNQKNAPAPDTSAKVRAHFSFEDGIGGEAFTYENGTAPATIEDTQKGGNTLHLNGGYVRYPNPLKNIELSTGASLTIWVKMPQSDIHGALFSFADDTTGKLCFTGNASLSYDGTGGWFTVNNPEQVTTGAISSGQWHFLALTLDKEGFVIFIDGTKKYDVNNHSGISGGTRATFDYANVVNFLTQASYFYLGYGTSTETKEVYFDDVKIYQNKIPDKMTVPDEGINQAPTPIYLNTFDVSHTAKIIGNGSFVATSDEHFGTVFKNATGGKRQNYLLLPEDVLSHSAESKEMSIGVWVNATYAGASGDYMWSPLFTAYGSAPSNGTNTFPMLALQYRGVVQVNCAGWCDFTDAQNVNNKNTLYHGDTDWLSDHKWHYYTATFTETTAAVYLDGKLANEWKMDGKTNGSILSGLFSNGAELKYICLGGNQAWDWNDPDPGFMFDDIAIYDIALTPEQIAIILSTK